MTNLRHPLIVLLLATTLGCSSDPDADDPVIINLEADSMSAETPDAGNAADDAATRDVEINRDEDTATAPDVAEEPDMSMPDLAPSGTVCQTKEAPIQLINTCTFEWSTCTGGGDYAFVCNVQNVAGNVFSLCNCFENGVMDEADKIVDICGLSDWADIEAVVNEQCGWDLR